MAERWIRIRGGGRIRIDPGRRGSQARPGSISPAPSRPPETTRADPGTSGEIEFDQPITERMEMRVESVFRPKTPDVEVVYVLTGETGNRPDRLHGLPTEAVVLDATTRSALPDVSKMIEMVQRERPGPIDLFIEVHTHPAGIASPSDADRIQWESAAAAFKAAFPQAQILFGIHAVSQEASEFLEKTRPKRTAIGRMSWRSYTRDHEFALFSSNAQPYGIRPNE